MSHKIPSITNKKLKIIHVIVTFWHTIQSKMCLGGIEPPASKAGAVTIEPQVLVIIINKK